MSRLSCSADHFAGGVFDPVARASVGDLGVERSIDTSATRKALGIAFTPWDKAVIAAGHSLVEHGAP